MKDISSRASQYWQIILHDKIGIPIRAVRRYDTQGLLLNATEIDPDTTQSTHELPTLDTNETDLKDTTPMVGNDAEADSHVGDPITLSTGEVSTPPTTSTLQKGCGATCLPEDDNTSLGLAVDGCGKHTNNH